MYTSQPSTSSATMGSKPTSSSEIVHLNVGGQRFSTSKSTLTWIPDTFFSSLLSGRISSTEDETGAYEVQKFIDRDPDLFRYILNYLRTKHVDLSAGLSLAVLTHEAEFYGITPLVKRLKLCEEMSETPCGNVLFLGLLHPPEDPPTPTVSPASSQHHMSAPQAEIISVSAHGIRERRLSTSTLKNFLHSDIPRHSSASFPGPSHKYKLNDNGDSQWPVRRPPYSGLLHSNVDPTVHQVREDLRKLVLRESELDEEDPSRNQLRVRLIRAHYNWIAVAYTNFACVYKMTESSGWKICFTSALMPAPIKHIAFLSRVPTQLTEKMLAIGLTSNLIHLYLLETETQVHRTVGVFSLDAQIDKLFFIGAQLVALSWSGKVGVWNSVTHNWQVQDVMPVSSYDTAGFILLLGCTNGCIYYIDMQKFPLRMKDNDLLITELYHDPNNDTITAISVYLTPKTNICGNWIEIAYGTDTGNVRVIVQHPETVGHGPQLFQTHSVHTSPITRVALTANHLISVCHEHNHVRTWSVARFRGMISTQPGGQSLASFKVMTLDSSPDHSPLPEGCNPGPYGEQDGEQLFVQRVVPDADTIFVLLASSGERLCTIRSVDGQPITAFFVHECEGSNRMGARPRRYLFVGTANGVVQMWDLTTALDQHQTRVQFLNQQLGQLQTVQVGQDQSQKSGASGSNVVSTQPSIVNLSSSLVNHPSILKGFEIMQGPTADELLHQIETCDLAVASLDAAPGRK